MNTNTTMNEPIKDPRNYRRYFRAVILVILAGLVMHALTILYVDPYRVFGLAHFNQKNFEPNTRYLKVKYLLEHEGFDAFIVGSSRVATYPVATASALSGRHYYNMTASGGNMEGTLAEVRWLLQNQNPKQLIIGLDYDAMFLSGSFSPYDLLRQEHYLVSGEHPAGFYLRYLTYQPNTVRRTIRKNRAETPTYYHFDITTGQCSFPFQDKIIAENPDLHARAFAAPGHSWGTMRPHNLELFHQMVALLKKHPAETIFVINPCHHLTMREYDLGDYTRWLRAVVDSGIQVWDFSGFNSVSTNNHNYYEVLHFRSVVAEKILARIFNTSHTDLPDDFGFLLTPETIDERIATLQHEFATYSTQPTAQVD